MNGRPLQRIIISALTVSWKKSRIIIIKAWSDKMITTEYQKPKPVRTQRIRGKVHSRWHKTVKHVVENVNKNPY